MGVWDSGSAVSLAGVLVGTRVGDGFSSVGGIAVVEIAVCVGTRDGAGVVVARVGLAVGTGTLAAGVSVAKSASAFECVTAIVGSTSDAKARVGSKTLIKGRRRSILSRHSGVRLLNTVGIAINANTHEIITRAANVPRILDRRLHPVPGACFGMVVIIPQNRGKSSRTFSL